ncbi:MAG TPA: hypothetical protein VIW29_08050, partial [Polyangiaceae bacterium]
MFTPENWMAQVVTVRGIDDAEVDGIQDCHIVLSPISRASQQEGDARQAQNALGRASNHEPQLRKAGLIDDVSHLEALACVEGEIFGARRFQVGAPVFRVAALENWLQQARSHA